MSCVNFGSQAGVADGIRRRECAADPDHELCAVFEWKIAHVQPSSPQFFRQVPVMVEQQKS
jgi:hypothetical protein